MSLFDVEPRGSRSKSSPFDAPEPAAAGRLAEVLVPVALDKSYTYHVPDGLDVGPGDVVAVGFGPREAAGVVWALREAPPGNVKPVLGRLDHPPLPGPLRAFLDWVAEWTLAPRGAVLRMALRGAGEERIERVQVGVRMRAPASQLEATPAPEPAAAGQDAAPVPAIPAPAIPAPAPPARRTLRLTPARQKALAAAADGLIRRKSELARLAGVGAGVIDGLVDEGVLEALPLPGEVPPPPPDPDHAAPDLTPAQAEAAQTLRALVAGEAGAGGYGAALLEGVTGSGKTEVYAEAVAEALRAGKQALVLLPEIALTGEFMGRFERRFGVEPGAWHSGVSSRRRDRLFAQVAEGSARLVVGARSALFLPFKELGLIVVDEEHEGAYKQEDGVPYHARDLAVMRARLENCAVVLASATPSVESRVNAARGRYRALSLPARFNARPVPSVEALDMRRARPQPGRWLSERLAEEVTANLAAGEQSLLFLNRRGYAPLTVCGACGHRLKCPQCSTMLVEHRFTRALRCHQCGHRERAPESCPSCGTVGALIACGPGVERLCEEVAERWPDARAIILSSDLPGGAERLRREIAEIAQGGADIIIGTQLVAKGHNFPHLTLVGVVDADLGLAGADPRAAERSFQVIAQVAGRAGRGEKPGRALIQTFDPGHPVMRALVTNDATGFYERETDVRREAGLPPFGRLAALVVSGRERGETEAYAREIARASEPPEGVMVLGPAEAPIAVIRGRHRFRLAVKTPREFDLQAYLRDWLARAPRPTRSLEVAVDVDPYSFL